MHKLLPVNQSSHKVALSVAMGIFIGVLPTIGVALFITVAINAMLRIPKLPGALSSFIAIPPTLIFFFYPAGYAVGSWIMEPEEITFSFLERFQSMKWGNIGSTFSLLWSEANEHMIAFLVGITIVALLFGALGYVLAYLGMKWRRRHYHIRKRQRHSLRKA